MTGGMHRKWPRETGVNQEELKSGGFIKQRQEGLYTVRLRCPGGRIPLERLKKICEVAERYGGKYVHLSVRQSLEIPYVDYSRLAQVATELGEAGQEIASCGPRVRVPTACAGCEYNPNGLTPTQELAQLINDRFFGQRCPHKFKISFSGCPIDCARTSEMDLGFQGMVQPVWEEGLCSGCQVCSVICQEGAIRAAPDSGQPEYEEASCLFCGDCIRGCPNGAWKAGRVGHLVRIGGKHGRHPLRGSIIARFITDQEVPLIVERVIEWYNREGGAKGRIRIGQLLLEPGMMSSLMDYLAEVLGDKAITNPPPPLMVEIHDDGSRRRNG